MTPAPPSSGSMRYMTDVVGLRAIAQIVDWFAIIGATIAIGMAFSVGIDARLSRGAVTILVGSCSYLYNAGLEGFWNGQTVGKRLVGIRVQDQRGADASAVQALIRNIPAIFSPGLLGYLVALLSIAMDDKKRRLFDRGASTIVVRG